MKNEEVSRISFLRMLSSARRSYSEIVKKKRRLILEKTFGKETCFCPKTTTSFACLGEFPFPNFKISIVSRYLKVGRKQRGEKKSGQKQSPFHPQSSANL